MARGIYNQNGEWDLSDEGEQVERINNSIDLLLIIKKLPLEEQKIAKMISEGYTRREIMAMEGVGQHKIEEILKILNNFLKIAKIPP